MASHYYPHPLTRAASVLSDAKSTKRKRSELEDDADSISSLESIKPQSSQSTWAEFLPGDVLQRKAAGLSAGEDIPGNHFPNRPEDYKRYLVGSTAPSQIKKELASLKPPLVDHLQYDKQLQFSRSSLKQQHISALYALLHRCLLDKDYLRAGRAFGLLLRTESQGQLPDLRNKNLWGIGAEILLCLGKQGMAKSSQKGIEDVKQYFESLIVQYPYRNKAPDAVSAAHFYPVLFGLWIASLDDKYKSGIQSIQDLGEPGEGHSIRQIDELEAIRRGVLVEAQAVISRMDEVMRSIPYSDDPTLWRLKGNMHLWINDLSQTSHESEDGSSMEGLDTEQTLGTNSSTSARKRADAAFAMAASYEQAEQNRSVYEYDSDIA